MHKVGEYLSEFLRRKIGACHQLSADFATYCENESLYKCLDVQRYTMFIAQMAC